MTRERPATNRHTPETTGPLSSNPAPAAMAGVQRGVFPLVGIFNLHSVSVCGRLYPLPRRTTFHFRNALHLMEARNRIAYVRGVFQRLLALLGESELGYGYPITNWLGQLGHCFPPSEHPLAYGRLGTFYHGITVAFPAPAAWCG